MNYIWVFILFVGLFVHSIAVQKVDDESEYFVKETDVDDGLDVQASLSLPWMWTKSSKVLLNPPTDPDDTELYKVLRRERNKLNAKIQKKEYRRALKQANNLLEMMLPASETTRNTQYKIFVSYLMKDKITCLRQLDLYMEAMVEAQNLMKYAADKLHDSEITYSKNLHTTVFGELVEKVNNLLHEYHSLTKSVNTQPSQLKEIHEKMIKMLPREGILLLNKDLQDKLTVLRKRVDNAGKNNGKHLF